MAFVVSTVVVTSPVMAAPFAAIVMDGRTGEVLYEKNADARLHPASLTKMMTLYIVFQEIEAGRLSLDTKVTVTKYAASQPPSRLGLKPGQKIAVRYLIRAAAIKSANDAAAALGDHIGGDHVTFAKRMTRTARQLGMDNTTFKNANGLTAEGHLSTARDMNTLGRHLFYDFPQYYHIFSRRTADAGIAQVSNTNTRFLDSYEGADGIKTGYTSPAGFNLTASAHRGNKHIIATVFGGTSTANRNAKMAELMDLGFGKAKNNVKEKPPVAAAVEDALVASLETGIDEIDAEGGAGKIVRVSGEVKTSPRPKARPVAPTVSDDVAIAMAEGIDGALAEATAAPAPEGTLEFQAEAMAEAATDAAPPVEPEVALAAADLPEVTSEVAVVEPEAAPVEVATAEPAVVSDAPGSFEAQAAALASGAPPAETQVAALTPAEEPAAVAEPDPALAGMKPRARPEGMTVQLATVEPVADPEMPAVEEVVVADAAPELVVTDPGTEVAAAAPETLLADVTGVETVAAPATVGPAPVELAAVVPATKRSAPIFDAVEVTEPAAEADEEVVVVMSTSGGRHFGVNVGEYPSRYEAEKALLKTALAESATLNDGLRKTTQSGGAWRASFMGLTEEQAELACRRLTARAVPCETVGG
ncbi:MAG: serine hydrolase [Tabrizicola sp.]|nr:serine hydrolase [Tabrizicola sp.]MBL9073847.1 serine hydrolase [Tabrizicola sp.]